MPVFVVDTLGQITGVSAPSCNSLDHHIHSTLDHTGLIIHNVLANAMLFAERADILKVVHLQVRVGIALGIVVNTGSSIVCHTDDVGIVLRPINSLNIACVLVNSCVLRSIHSPDNDIKVSSAAYQELAVWTPANVIDIHGMTSTSS